MNPECPDCGSGKFYVLLYDTKENRMLAEQATNVVVLKSKSLNGKYQCRKCQTIFDEKGKKHDKSTNTRRRKRRTT